MDFLMEDTITAVSTPPGQGGIGIVRISGNLSLQIASEIFKTPKGRTSFNPRRVYYGNIVDPQSGQVVDEALLTFMKAPRSYTTQDLAEFNCHGGPAVLRKVINLIVAAGARPAQPGEFTKRAFLGGRIDLAQAEAVMDLIQSKTDQARQVAVAQLKGNLSRLIDELREELIDLKMQIEVRIDFCEDDIPPLPKDFKMNKIEPLIQKIGGILESFEKGRIYREGVRACILGPPNVGKSTLLNYFLGQERAIVTPIPGTTRDRIEETANLKGVPVVFIDTAGIRKSDDPVEEAGINLAFEAARSSSITLLVLDASSPEMPDLPQFLKVIDAEKTLVIMNKTDLGVNYPEDFVLNIFSAPRIIQVSLALGSNLEKLENKIVDMIFSGRTGSAGDVILSNLRHRDALEKTRRHLNCAFESVCGGMPDDCVTIDLNTAIDCLGEITGKLVYEDLMNRVFNNFCIGK